MDCLSSFQILQVLLAVLMVFCCHNVPARAQIVGKYNFIACFGVFLSCLSVVLYCIIEQCSSSDNGAIRLWKHGTTSRSYMSGTVQICFDHYWGNVCDKPRFGFGFQEAHVVCHQLGYTGASKFASNRYLIVKSDLVSFCMDLNLVM